MLPSVTRLYLVRKPTDVLVLLKLSSSHIGRFYSNENKTYEWAKCYQILEVPNNSDQETVRRAFINLCKKYHPDSGKSSADEVKFQQVESAYRSLQNKFASERWDQDEEIGEYGLYYKEKKGKDDAEIFDIKHTAPQHRQYLSFDGVGSGTPSQRQKQYVKYRTVVAVENVYDHQIKKVMESDTSTANTLVSKDKKAAKKIKTRFGMERLVEDLIQESIANGLFDNLKGQGKPLPPKNYNPYVDFVTHKMNEVMMENGFTPEWITLQKEISEDIGAIKDKLSRERSELGPLPLDSQENFKWNNAVERMKDDVQRLNQKINKFNLLVPVLDKQKLYFDLKKVSCDILNTGLWSDKKERKELKEVVKPKQTAGVSFFRFRFLNK